MVRLATSYLMPLVAAATAQAANDWSVKCKQNCSYDTNGKDGSAFATVSIGGSNAQIMADITTAASWEILDCPSDWAEGARDIRLVCTADDPSQDCDDVTNGGAVDTVVRLPEACGKGPFARISAWGVADDQDIPTGSAAEQKLRLRKRSDPVKVMVATLDWKMKEVSPERGSITLDIKASNSPFVNSQIVATRSLKHALHAKRSSKRFLDGIGDAIGGIVDDVGDAVGDVVDGVEEGAGDAVDQVGDVVGDVGEGVGDVVGDIGEGVGDVVGDIGDVVGDANNVDLGDSGNLDTIKVQQNFPLFETTLACSFGPLGFDATVNGNVDIDMEANVGFAFLMKGTVVPPAIDDFGLAAVMSGFAKGKINLDAFLSGDIDTGNIPLFQLGIPGLSIPGIFSLGPQAVINARATAAIGVNTKVSIPVTWNFPLLDFVIPADKGPAKGEATESTSTANFEVSFAPGELTGSLEAHIIPGLEFGIDALAGFAQAEVFINADADGLLQLDGIISEDFSMEGCTTASIGIDVKAGARGTFLNFFNEQTTIPIFNKRAELFKKCFGAGDGPASALLDNGDGTFTNASGDLVNENGELIDEEGNVIPDEDAAPPDEVIPPVLDEQGNPIPDDQVIFDNGDGTFEDGLGNPTNAEGQLIDEKGNLLGSELDLAGAVDGEDQPIPPEEVLVENEDGTFSDADGNIVDADGLVNGADGFETGASLEPILDEAGNPIPEDEIIIDNEDGTFSDFFGNIVDQWGGAIDFDADGNVLPVALTPEAPLEQPEQIVDPPPVTTDPEFVIRTPEEVKQIALDLINGALAAPPADAPPPPEAPPAEEPPAEAPPPEAPPADAPPAKAKRFIAKRALGCQPFISGGLPVLGVDQLTRFF